MLAIASPKSKFSFYMGYLPDESTRSDGGVLLTTTIV